MHQNPNILKGLQCGTRVLAFFVSVQSVQPGRMRILTALSPVREAACFGALIRVLLRKPKKCKNAPDSNVFGTFRMFCVLRSFPQDQISECSSRFGRT
jgi:hypothetical protein